MALGVEWEGERVKEGSPPKRTARRSLRALLTTTVVPAHAPSYPAEAIDVAFVDRADIKAYIGPPNLEAR